MPCCGQNREKAKVAAAPLVHQPEARRVVAKSVGSPAPPVPLGPTVKLRYNGVAEIGVRGTRTGRTYLFSAAAPERAVDRRDAEALLRVGLFRAVV